MSDTIRDVFNNNKKFTLIAGPCVIESENLVINVAKKVKSICDKVGIDYYFKSSFDKANRTTAEHFRGPGLEKGLEILQRVRDTCGIKIVTDIHEPWQAEPAGKVVDIIQIPAFLCRQTDLLEAAAKTGKTINVKKAQFMSPEEIGKVIAKLEYFGNKHILLCERGTCFGYNNLIVDMTSFIRMHKYGYPIVFDATHSVQISGGGVNYTNSGTREYVPYLVQAAVAAGADALFMEVHPEPEKGLCDASCMYPVDKLEALLLVANKIYELKERDMI
ncbi:2-dehydro-3-deoxyphosphooctonate aldolase [Spirochaetia bacterium]|nr:2-dehydro-3-deoxyphosphooctonate aldolase [Spirochaetia bacterium]